VQRQVRVRRQVGYCAATTSTSRAAHAQRQLRIFLETVGHWPQFKIILRRRRRDCEVTLQSGARSEVCRNKPDCLPKVTCRNAKTVNQI
jgi:hypothetical protein